MNIKTIIAAVFVLLLTLSCSRIDTNRAAGWQGIISQENGVTIVRNPTEPAFGEWIPELEENLRLGNDEDDNYQFFRVADILLDAEENIYILDAGNHRVQKFEKDGLYLLTMGKEGQGPGEFQNPIFMAWDHEDNLCITDNHRIHVFDNAGTFERSITLENSFMDFFFDAEGNIIANVTVPGDDGPSRQLRKYDSTGKELEQLVRFEDVRPVREEDETGYTVTFKAYHQYSLMPAIRECGDGAFIFGWPAEFSFSMMDTDGKLLRRIERAAVPIPITQDEKDFITGRIGQNLKSRGYNMPREVLERMCQFPPHRPFYGNILTDEMGRILVRTAGSVLEQGHGVELDIFDSQGRYIYRMKLPFMPDFIKQDDYYDISVSDETGEVLIIRYIVTNMSQLKTDAED